MSIHNSIKPCWNSVWEPTSSIALVHLCVTSFHHLLTLIVTRVLRKQAHCSETLIRSYSLALNVLQEP
jgi:hypothetical protein